MTAAYTVRHLEHDDDTSAWYLVRTEKDGTEDLIDLELVEDLMTLRGTDIEALEHVWNTVELLLERGAPLDALDG